MVAMDQIANHLGKLRYMSGGRLTIPVVIRTAMGGGYGDAAQQSQTLYSMIAHAPGVKVVVPSNPYDAKGLLISAIRDENPVIIFEHKLLYGVTFLPPGSFGEVPEEEYEVPLGTARILREGQDITIIGIAYTARLASEAAHQLLGHGIRAEVVDLRSLVPLDRTTILNSARKTGRVLVVDEDYLSYGLTGEIVAILVEDHETFRSLKCPVERIANPDSPVPFSEPLEKAILPSTDKIVVKALRMLGRSS